MIWIYKILIFPLTFTEFFKYGIPYCYLTRNVEAPYYICWYFNNEGGNISKVKGKNYSSAKFLGYKLSLYCSYRQFFKRYIKFFKSEPDYMQLLLNRSK
jgi:hypothetical protein